MAKVTFGFSTSEGGGQNPLLKRVDLMVSRKNFKINTILGTETKQINGVYQDPCAGDSGGPLMYEDKSSQRWSVIGQINIIALFIELSILAKIAGFLKL